MPATRQDLIFEIGADGPEPSQFVWSTNDDTPVDLTGATAKLEIRADYDADVVLTMSTANDRIVIADSIITLAIGGAEITDELLSKLTQKGTVTAGVIERESGDLIVSAFGFIGFYDLKVTLAGGEIARLLSGKACFSREITR